MTSLRNSVILFFSVPTITTVFGLAISWVVIRSKWRIGQTFNVCVSASRHPQPHPRRGCVPAGHPLVSYSIRSLRAYCRHYNACLRGDRISFSTRMLNSGLLQIHEELDEAGYVAGLGPVEVIRKILIPLLSATLVYSWLWMALLSFRELTVAAFLASRGNLTLPVTIWSIWNNGQLNQAAAAALVFVGLLTPLIILYFAFGRRRISMPQ